MTTSHADGTLRQAIREEWFLGVSLATVAAFALAGPSLLQRLAEPFWFTLLFVWLFATILGSIISVVRHADHVAEMLGEPYGTLVLTLAVTGIEVMSITAVMLHGDNNPTLVRDTLFAIVMIILGGMVGMSLLLGGWRHREQHYNLQGANAYLGAIIPLAVLTLCLPNYTVTTPGPTLSSAQQIFVLAMSIGLYAVFLAVQTGRHRGYFSDASAAKLTAHHAPGALRWHGLLLVAYIAPVVFLADQFAYPIDHLIETMHAPTALGGIIIAMLVAAPEALGAMRAALANHLQRSINISLGSVLATIGMTVPVMLAISHLTDHPLELGLGSADNMLLLLTLAVSVVTFASGRTNVLQGAVHIVLFAAFVLLIFQN